MVAVDKGFGSPLSIRFCGGVHNLARERGGSVSIEVGCTAAIASKLAIALGQFAIDALAAACANPRRKSSINTSTSSNPTCKRTTGFNARSSAR